MKLIPLVEMSEDAKRRLWREDQRMKLWLERVASHLGERMLQIEISLHGQSPEYEMRQQLSLQLELSAKQEETEYPQPVALLPLNLSRNTLQMLNVIVQNCTWFGELITAEDIGFRGKASRTALSSRPYHTLLFPEYMIQVASGTKYIPPIPRYEVPLNERRI